MPSAMNDFANLYLKIYSKIFGLVMALRQSFENIPDPPSKFEKKVSENPHDLPYRRYAMSRVPCRMWAWEGPIPTNP